MSQYDKIVSGSYVATGAAKTIQIPFIPDWFELHIRGNASGDVWEAAGPTGVVKSAWWAAGMADATALTVQNTAAAATDERVFVASDGISAFETDPTLLGAAFTISGITNAAPPVVTTTTNHGYTTGDVVILTGTTAALQIATIPYQVTVLSPTTFSLVNMGAPGSAATAGFCRKILFPSVYLPRIRFLTAVTQAVNPTLTFSVDHGYVVGESIRLHCTSAFGMVEMDGLQATVLTVPSASTITIDVDTSAFTTFAFPLSAVASLGVTFPHTCPIGVEPTVVVPANPSAPFELKLNTSFVDTGSRGILLGATVAGSSGALVVWRATQAMKVYTS